MSPLPIRSPKHCAKKELNISKRHKKVFFVFSSFSLSIISLIFLVWVILHPSKPKFSLKEADMYNSLNISSSRLFNSSIQLTLLSKNPNKRVGIYYDELQVCASYKGQQITNETSIPPFYQGHEESNILSAYSTLVGPIVGRAEGERVLSLRANGRLRWQVGSWVSGSHNIKVLCVATINFGPLLGSLSFKQGSQCSTSV